MKIQFRRPLDKGDIGSIFIYDLKPLESTPMLEEIMMTKKWIDVLYDEEKEHL